MLLRPLELLINVGVLWTLKIFLFARILPTFLSNRPSSAFTVRAHNPMVEEVVMIQLQRVQNIWMVSGEHGSRRTENGIYMK